MALARPILLHPLSNNLGSSCLITWHSGSRTEFFNGIGRKLPYSTNKKTPALRPALRVRDVGRRQWPEDLEAPSPVSARTCCALKAPRSFAACALRSVMEKNQMPAKAIAIENSAGEV